MASLSSSSPPSKWASLPADLLELLLGFQKSFFDQLRFGAVCRSWKAAATALLKRDLHCRCGGPSLPLLTFVDPTKGGGRRAGGRGAAAAASPEGEDKAAAEPPITRCFYSLAEDKVYRLQVPCESLSWRCLGSSHGWLSMVDHSAKPFLFNPISGARIDLPSLATLSRLILAVETREEDGASVYIYQDPLHPEYKPCRYTGEDMRDFFAGRVVLSSSPLDPNSVAMAAVCEYHLLAYTRLGDDSWFEVRTGADCFRDIIFHDSRFYAIACSGETIAIDFFKDSKVPHCGHIPPTVEVLVPEPTPSPHFYEDGMYLVALPSGEIIQVIRYVKKGPLERGVFDRPDYVFSTCDRPYETEAYVFSILDRPYETEAFDFHKLEVGSNGGEWVEVDSIGNYCLFLGLNQSMALPASQVLGKYRANCIFFTDDIKATHLGDERAGLDFGIFDMEDESETIEHFCHIDARRVVPLPMWITPTL